MANNFSDVSSTSGCTKHPSVHRLPGVCSSCLSERLHQLVLSPEDTAAAYPSQRLYLKSPSYSSSSFRHYDSLPGGPWSPPAGSRRIRGHGLHRRNGSAAAEGGSVLLSVRAGGSLRKSRSVAVVAGGLDEGEREEEEGVKMVKRGGFWSKLIRLRSGRRKEKESWSHHHHRSATLRDIFMY